MVGMKRLAEEMRVKETQNSKGMQKDCASLHLAVEVGGLNQRTPVITLNASLWSEAGLDKYC